MSTADEYTPTTEEVIRGYRLPRPVVDPQREDESFADYISRVSIEGHGLQVQSEAAARRWLEGERARVRAEAFREAAERITREAPADECAMHDVMRVAALPHLSRVMLNGVTRSAERLRAMAGDIERGTNHTNRSE
ncbi:MAG: hypothetical protein CMH34_09865 [Microbacterium sp.]|nr:hypothetical protein [Microbacterium sp.]